MYEYPLTPTLAVSFQRFPLRTNQPISKPPRSWGALPLLPQEDGDICVAVPRDEACWIGLLRSNDTRWTLQVLVTLTSGERLDAVSGLPRDDAAAGPVQAVSSPPSRALLGITAGDGTWWPFTRSGDPATGRLEILGLEYSRAVEQSSTDSGPRRLHDFSNARTSGSASALRFSPLLTAELIDPEDFAIRGGSEVPALDPASPYDGRRLP